MHNLKSPNTVILCVFSMAEALQTFIKKELCMIIRTTPFLILSSQSCHVERIKVFQAGAHAYIGEPYSLVECLAQAQSLMELYCDLKPQQEICYTLAFGKDIIINPAARKGNDLRLTKKEFDLLFCLASNSGQVFSREQLYDHVWDEYSAYNVDEVVKA